MNNLPYIIWYSIHPNDQISLALPSFILFPPAAFVLFPVFSRLLRALRLFLLDEVSSLASIPLALVLELELLFSGINGEIASGAYYYWNEKYIITIIILQNKTKLHTI